MGIRRDGPPGPGDYLVQNLKLIRGPPWWSAYQFHRLTR